MAPRLFDEIRFRHGSKDIVYKIPDQFCRIVTVFHPAAWMELTLQIERVAAHRDGMCPVAWRHARVSTGQVHVFFWCLFGSMSEW